jgi:hypothetical protein
VRCCLQLRDDAEPVACPTRPLEAASTAGFAVLAAGRAPRRAVARLAGDAAQLAAADAEAALGAAWLALAMTGSPAPETERWEAGAALAGPDATGAPRPDPPPGEATAGDPTTAKAATRVRTTTA